MNHRPFPRRQFLRGTALTGLALSCGPSLFLRAANASASRGSLRVAQVGCGRMGTEDMRGVLEDDRARVVAVCDLDPRRLAKAKATVEEFYRKKGAPDHPVLATAEYLEIVSHPDIDAVVVSTPDHWHALVAIAAARHHKHLYVQKPLTYSIGEAIALRSAVQKSGVVLQVGSQQRSEMPFPAFRAASEVARSGRLGKVHTVKVGIGMDKPSGAAPGAQADPLPAGFNFDRWLGPAPEQLYFEKRVHPQADYGRPGWITTEDFGLGMITNWGAHHLDIVLWGLGLENSGPRQISAQAKFMVNDYFTVHQEYHAEIELPQGTRLILDQSFENGIRFEGDEGWAFCNRGSAKVTKTDGNADTPAADAAFRYSRPSLVKDLPADALRWPASPNHYRDWISAILDRRAPIAPIDQATRSLAICAATWIAMKVGRPVVWDPLAEKFINDAGANALLDRPARRPEFDHRLL